MEYDLTKQSDVVSLMQSSKSESAWNDNCDKVKAANGGDYPSFWFAAIIMSGIINMWLTKRAADLPLESGKPLTQTVTH